MFKPGVIIGEKLRAKIAVDEFLADMPSIFEIQTYVQMARNDLANNPNDFYAKHIIYLLEGDNG